MYNVVKQNGRDVHLVVKPDVDCVVNQGIGSIRGSRIAEMSYSDVTFSQQQRLTQPLCGVTADGPDELGRRARPGGSRDGANYR
jgi:hypothetical protein